MSLTVLSYDNIPCEQWAALVSGSRTGTWFQTPEAYEFFAAQPELFEPFALGVSNGERTNGRMDERTNGRTDERTNGRMDERTNGRMDERTNGRTDEWTNGRTDECSLRGVCCGFVTVEKNPLKQFLTRRAIIIGGPCLADDATDEEVMALMRAICAHLKQRAIYIETRNLNDYSKWRKAFEHCGVYPRRRPLLPFHRKDAPGFRYEPHYNCQIDTSSKARVLDNMDRGRRRNVASSIQAGCKIVAEPTLEQVREWYRILQRLYQEKVKTPLFPWSFFEKLYALPDSRFYLVEYEGRIIGGIAAVVSAGKAIYEWFGCGVEHIRKGVFPSVYSTYGVLMDAAENHIPRVDMMGAGKPGEKYGVREFKQRFGGELVEHGRFVCVEKPILYKIGTMGVKMLKRIR